MVQCPEWKLRLHVICLLVVPACNETQVLSKKGLVELILYTIFGLSINSVITVEPRHVASKHISKPACLGNMTCHFVSPRLSSPRAKHGNDNNPCLGNEKVEVEIRARAGGVEFRRSKSGSRRDGELNLDPPGRGYLEITAGGDSKSFKLAVPIRL
ncbi:hypothetical protein BDV97DRAFT_369702 [Delphinella strobiligena]|nr:hypothetical protein BDV97DRAFT_369702 [Delphinella strobiligena]